MFEKHKITKRIVNDDVLSICFENQELDGLYKIKLIIEGNDLVVISDFGTVTCNFTSKITMDKLRYLDIMYFIRKVTASSFELFDIDKNAVEGLFQFDSIPYLDKVIEYALAAKSYKEFKMLIKQMNVETKREYEEEFNFVENYLKILNDKTKFIHAGIQKIAEVYCGEKSRKLAV